MDIIYFRLISIIIITFVYMLFDVFNKRNVPALFAYATLAYGVILTILYFNINKIFISSLIAAAILALGYVIYRYGQLGAADVIELAALSLILPIQSIPIFNHIATIGFPFVVSVIINSGIAALIIVPLYYIPLARSKFKGKLLKKIRRKDGYKGIIVIITYSVFALFLILRGIGFVGMSTIITILIGAAVILLFQRPITLSMIDEITFKHMEEEDIIALNLIDKKEIVLIKKKIPDFGGLVTKKLLSELKRKFPSKKFPIYRRAVPFALAIFVGSVIAITVGNLILYMIPYYI